MNEYRVVRVSGVPDWSTVEKAPVALYPWGGEYRPETFGQVVLEEGRGFRIRMSCREQNPLAVHTQPDDPVCQDSCLEFFADFVPEKGVGYLNLEANSLGTLLLGLGVQRAGRVRVRELGCPLPTLTAFREGEYWGWEALVPFSMLGALYGKDRFEPGDVFSANLYKCGDKTAVEHYGVWNPVTAPSPDFHRPECFGRMTVV